MLCAVFPNATGEEISKGEMFTHQIIAIRSSSMLYMTLVLGSNRDSPYERRIPTSIVHVVRAVPPKSPPFYVLLRKVDADVQMLLRQTVQITCPGHI
jgi:hypothetical protein